MRYTAPGAAVLADRLIALDAAGELTYRGLYDRDTNRYEISVNGSDRIYPVSEMIRWVTGWTAAATARPVPAAESRRTPLGLVRRVLVNPSVEDQYRIAIRVAMEDRGLNVAEMAKLQGVNRKPFSQSIRFLGPGLYSVMATLGHNTLADRALADADPDVDVDLVVDRREPRRLQDVRIMAYCHEQGVIEWIGPKTPVRQVPSIDPTTTMTAFQYQLGLHQRPDPESTDLQTVVARHDVPVPAMRAWITGVADRLVPAIGQRIYEAYPTTP